MPITLSFTYDKVDEESAQQEDFCDHGWYEPGGWFFSCYDNKDNLNPYEQPKWEKPGDLRAAINSARNLGICEPSSYPNPSPGDWWHSHPEIDYSTGEEITYAFHVDGVTPSTWRRIHKLLTT